MASSILGKDVNTGNLVSLEQMARLRGLYVIGKTGSGKTTLLQNLILQDIEQGRGLCFFDTHGDAINAILPRIPKAREHEVILLDLLDTEHPIGLNLYQCANPHDAQQVSLTVSYVLEVFAKLFADGDLSKTPRMAQVLRNTAITMIANPGMTMAEIPLLLTDENAREKLIKNVKNLQVQLFWQRYNRMKPNERHELIDSTLNKLDEFLTDEIAAHIFGQSKTTINFRQVMDSSPGKIILVKLSRKYPQLTSLVGSVLIGQIANAAFSREDTAEDKRVQFNLYADEYERFATPTFAELLAEVRKYKIATCVAHQWRQQLDIDNRKATLNVGTLVVFQVSGEDGEELAKQFKAEPQPQPGAVIPEMRMEPVYQTYNERAYSDSTINKELVKIGMRRWYLYYMWEILFSSVGHELESRREDISILSTIRTLTYPFCLPHSIRCFGVMPFEEVDIKLQLPFDPAVSSRANQQLLQYVLVNSFYRYFIPDFTDKRVQEYLFTKIYTPDSTLRKPILRDPHTLEYQFPAELPTVAENRLEQLVKKGEVFTKSHDVLIRPQVSKYFESSTEIMEVGTVEIDRGNIAATLLKQLQEGSTLKDGTVYPGLTVLKRKAFYGFEPAGITRGIFLPEHWNENKLGNNPSGYLELAAKNTYGYWSSVYFPAVLAWFRDICQRWEDEETSLGKLESEWESKRLEYREARTFKGWQPVYDHKARGKYEERTALYTMTYRPGPLESPSDAEKRVAKELANPKKKYTAQVKLESGEEYCIEIEQTEQFRPALPLPDTLARQQRIVDQSRQNYSKRRIEVEQVIVVRQEELTKQDKKPPRSRQDEDEK